MRMEDCYLGQRVISTALADFVGEFVPTNNKGTIVAYSNGSNHVCVSWDVEGHYGHRVLHNQYSQHRFDNVIDHPVRSDSCWNVIKGTIEPIEVENRFNVGDWIKGYRENNLNGEEKGLILGRSIRHPGCYIVRFQSSFHGHSNSTDIEYFVEDISLSTHYVSADNPDIEKVVPTNGEYVFRKSDGGVSLTLGAVVLVSLRGVIIRDDNGNTSSIRTGNIFYHNNFTQEELERGFFRDGNTKSITHKEPEKTRVKKPSVKNSLKDVKAFIKESSSDPEITTEGYVCNLEKYFKDIKRSLVQNAKFCCIFSNGDVLWNTFTPCYRDLKFIKEQINKDLDVTYLVCCIQAGGKTLKALNDEQQAFYIWLFNDSPFSSVFVTKDPKEAYEEGVVIDCNNPENLVASAAMAVRYGYEQGAYKAITWNHFVNFGYDMNHAFVLSHYFDLHYGVFNLFNYKEHTVLEVFGMKKESINNFLNGKVVDTKGTFSKLKTHNRVSGTWGSHRALKDYTKQGLWKKLQTFSSKFNTKGGLALFNEKEVIEASNFLLSEHLGAVKVQIPLELILKGSV